MTRLSARGFLALTGATLLAAFAAVLVLPHDPYIRYQSFKGGLFDRLDWIYERIHFADTPIDIALIGSSRTGRGVVPTLLEAELDRRGAGDLRVANFSMPAAGMDVRLVKARELLETRDVRLMVISVVEALPRDGHQAFGDLAPAGEVLTAPWLVNRRLPASLARLPYRQMELSLATLVPGAFGYRGAFDPADYAGATVDTRVFNPDWTPEVEAAIQADPGHPEALAEESAMRKRQIRPPLLPDSLAWIEFGVSRHYIREIAALAEARGTRLVFLNLPFYQGYDAPVDRAFLEGIAPLWIAETLKDDPSHYNDAAHGSRKGAELITAWLAPKLIARLEDAP